MAALAAAAWSRWCSIDAAELAWICSEVGKAVFQPGDDAEKLVLACL